MSPNIKIEGKMGYKTGCAPLTHITREVLEPLWRRNDIRISSMAARTAGGGALWSDATPTIAGYHFAEAMRALEAVMK